MEKNVVRVTDTAMPSSFLDMQKLSPTAQRLILAFTTGLFLACAAGVSASP